MVSKRVVKQAAVQTVLTVCVPLRLARDVQQYLRSNDLYDHAFRFLKNKTHIWHVVKKRFKMTGEVGNSIVFEKRAAEDFPQSERAKSLKDLLTEVLSNAEIEQLKTSYDIVGSIAILEIDDQLRSKEEQIAKALLASNPTLKTVLRKDGSHEGVYRNQKMKFLAGIDTRVTTHMESGVSLIVDVETVYFSPRLSTERLRITDLVTPGESVLVMFSGAAPYPCVIAKRASKSRIVGIEINPDGHKYGELSVKSNKLTNVELFCGDVHTVLPSVVEKYVAFDRIVMPLPKTAGDFLDDALIASKDGTVIHFYDFLHEDEFGKAIEKINTACAKRGVRAMILGTHTCGCQGVRTYRICVDFMVKNDP